MSYLFVSEQRKVAENMDVDFGMDMKKSAVLREVSKQNKLNDSAIREIMMYGNLAAEGDLAAEGEVPTTRKPIKVKISTDICDRYFAPDWDNKKVQEIIELALEQYFNKSTGSDDTDRFIMDDEDKYQI